MAKYSQYIEISPDYESVVDLSSEQRHPDMWMSYIVHEDMADAIDKITQSLKNENKDARRSFWIHGSYGTGKSYAAIVLKHLFEDKEDKIRRFMANPKLLPYREKFCALRRKGEYLVVWKSGCSEIRTGVQLIMEAEVAIRTRLQEKFGDNAYLGENSTLDAVKERLNDPTINWENVFNDSDYALFEDYDSLDALKDKINNNDTSAANRIASIILQKGWGLFSSTATFKAWLKDVIHGNNLQDTGIVLIWDEFTDYLRNNTGDTNVLQELSEYCKQEPFFMCLIVHKDASWVDTMGEGAYNRIVHRYHELSFHITEDATYDLISGSILTRTGMDQQWHMEKDILMKSIAKQRGNFVDADLGSGHDRYRELCPIHPMTISLLSKVAENFGASQRTLFRFMKDPEGREQKVGFLYYIDNFGPEDWRWLTPDFLWDYFFLRPSDIKEFSPEAQRCYQHYQQMQDFVNKNPAYLRIFKTCLLLISLMSQRSTSNTIWLTRASNGKLVPTRNTVINCYAGVLEETEVRNALQAIGDSKLLRFDEQRNGDARLELPFAGATNLVENKQAEIAKKYTRHVMFGRDGFCAQQLQQRMWIANDPYTKRIQIVVTSPDTATLNQRQKELQETLEKKPYALGMLVVAPAEATQFVSMQDSLRTIAKNDPTGRMIVVLLKTPFTEEQLTKWYRAIANKELAAAEGQKGNADNYEEEANSILSEWAVSAASSNMVAFYKEQAFTTLFNVGSLSNVVKKQIFAPLFPYAAERFIILGTAYKSSNKPAALLGLTREPGNAQQREILNAVQRYPDLAQADTIEVLSNCSGSAAQDAIAKLAEFLIRELTQGARVDLDELWQKLQNPPFGYYDTMASAFVLGYVFRFYLDREYTWLDNTGNPHQLSNKDMMAEMIAQMCKGKLINNALSSGSQTWGMFKPYAKVFFALTDEACASEAGARRACKGRIVDYGIPFWILKYLPVELFGSLDSKETSNKIVDSVQAFLDDPGAAETHMAAVVDTCKGQARIKRALTEAYKNPAKRNEVLRNFIHEKAPQLEEKIGALSLDNSDLLNDLRHTMEGDTSSWQEEDVIQKLSQLQTLYDLILAVNSAIGTKHKTIGACQSDLKNCFASMKVPGSVIEAMDYTWIDAMKAMYHLSRRSEYLADLISEAELHAIEENGPEAWQYITNPKLVVRKYLENMQVTCTEDELSTIFGGLHTCQYDTQPAIFREGIQHQLTHIQYSRLCHDINTLWTSKTATDNIAEWCKKYECPITWMFTGDDQDAIRTIYDMQRNAHVTLANLKASDAFLKNTDLTKLTDTTVVENCFFAQVGEEFREVFKAEHDKLMAQLRSTLGPNIYVWDTQIGQIIRTLRSRQKELAKQRDYETAISNAKTMPDTSLRERIEKMLNENPEFSRYFI